MGEEAAHESEAIDSWWNRQRPRPLQEGESGAIRRVVDGTYWALKIKMRLLLESTTIN